MIKKQFLDDLDQTHMHETIRSLKRALLIFHSPVDNIVGIDNARHMFETALHPKSFISLDDADHLLTNAADSQYVGSVIAAWAHKYLDEEKAAPPAEPAPAGTVVVYTGKAHYRTEIEANNHRTLADEPREVGGTDQGPTPYDYLLSALGSCTSITLRMYADRKKWPLEGITVRLKHEKVHATDCAACETPTGLIDHIERELELTGPLDDEQRSRLVEIADRCPVHRTLHSEIVVKTRLKENA